MKRNLTQIAVLLSMLTMGACATILNTTKQKVSLTSNPIGAEVYINGKSTNKTTPCTVWVKRKVKKGPANGRNQYIYEFRKDGFVPYIFTDNAEVSSKIWLNLFLSLAALPAFGVDFILGGAYYYNDDVLATLQKESTSYVVIRDTVVKQVYVTAPEAKAYMFEKLSDVDVDIPNNNLEFPLRFALIIGNEDYSSKQVDLNKEVNVDFARNDASAFKEYAIKVLGIPESNIIFLLDATTGQMNQAIAKTNLIIKNAKGKAEVFVYYAGHGLPDEITREPYLIPVEISGQNARDGIRLIDLYAKLTEYPSKRVIVFLDACFSGGARNKELIAARGVKVRPTETVLQGNIATLSAVSGEQTALPLKDKHHGFFTYYLLKKLKETKGNITLKELSTYLDEVVPLQSVLLISKEQTPVLRMGINSTVDLENWVLTKSN